MRTECVQIFEALEKGEIYVWSGIAAADKGEKDTAGAGAGPGGGQWFLYSQYQDKGFMQSCTDKEGHISSKWTQAGRKFVIEFLLDLGYVLNKDVNE